MAGLVIKTIREAIKTQLDAASLARDVAVYAYNPFAADPNGTHDYPCIIIRHSSQPIEYQTTFGPKGVVEMTMELEIRASAADGISGEIALDDLLSAGTGSTSSIFDALAADVTAGGVVVSATSLRVVSPPRLVQLGEGGVPFWSATLSLLVLQPRS